MAGLPLVEMACGGLRLLFSSTSSFALSTASLRSPSLDSQIRWMHPLPFVMDVLCSGLRCVAFLGQVMSHFRLVVIQQIRVWHDNHWDIQPPCVQNCARALGKKKRQLAFRKNIQSEIGWCLPAWPMMRPLDRSLPDALQRVISSIERLSLDANISIEKDVGMSSFRLSTFAAAHGSSGPHWTRRSVKPCAAKWRQKSRSRTAVVSLLKPTVAPTVTRQYLLVPFAAAIFVHYSGRDATGKVGTRGVSEAE